jgi:formylglycine-generating enzyme required for sulfatase activity
VGNPATAGRTEQLSAAPIPQSSWSTAEREWQQYGKDTKDIRLLEAFKEKHKADPLYVRLAEARIEELKKQQAASADPSWWEKLTGGAQSAPPPKSAPPEQVAIAMPPAQPTPPVPPTARCDGIEITVGQNERRCFKPGAGKTEHFKDCPTCPDMVVVPAGSFTMGSPANEPGRGSDEAQMRVSIPAPFAVGRFAVTFDEWDACFADGGCNGYEPADQGWGRGKHPVINVNWDDAKAYTAWLSRKTGKSYRLPSEAEREYVTRAGTTTPFWWGSSITPQQANYDGSADLFKGGGSKRTVPVDSFEPNPWGLYNVHGNVWEWTEDCSNPGDGNARTSGNCSRRVVRGGSWLYIPQYLRSAFRYRNSTVGRSVDLGFRLARTLTP